MGRTGWGTRHYLSDHSCANREKRLGDHTNFVSFARRKSKRGNFWQDYVAAEPHHGTGLTVLNDRTGPLNRFSAYGTYAYHIGISGKTTVAAGFGAGISNLSLNASKVDFGPQSQVDPAVSTGNENQ